MVSREHARFAVGVVGNVISCFLFLSPIPTFIRVVKKKDVEEFQYYPYVATVLNCMLWVFYGLPVVNKDNILVTTINSFGLAVELIYLAIFYRYDRLHRGRKQVVLGLIGEVIFMVALILITLLCFHKLSTRSLLVGVFCDALNIIMYGSPLLIMRKVIKTKSVEFMPFYLSLTNFLNGACWTTYALIKFDLFILISNGLGALFGALQLALYAFYYKSTPKHTDDVIVKPSEMQLPQV